MGVNIEKITAADFLEAMANSGRSGEDLVGFRQLKAELERHPKVKEGLAFEFLEITWKAIESGTDPSIGGYAFHFYNSITQRRRAKYSVALEAIIRRLFKAVGQKTLLADQCCPDAFALRMALVTLRVTDGRRFRATVSALRRTLGVSLESELRCRILAEADQSKAQMEQAIRELARHGHKEKIEAEAQVASYKN